MIHLKLTVLVDGMVALGDMEAFLQGPLSLRDESAQRLRNIVVTLRALLAEMEMGTSARGADRLIQVLGQDPLPPSGYIQQLITALVITVKDEMHSVTAYQVPAGKVDYLRPEPFGPEVHQRFRSADYDIREAGQCLSYGRNTACAFHLMRTMETGLRALGAALKDPSLDPGRNPSWETILRKCDQELQKPLKDRAPEWAADEPFFSTATVNLRAVKNAWRNPTMHVDHRYNDEEARDVWNAVRAFMRHLATKLP